MNFKMENRVKQVIQLAAAVKVVVVVVVVVEKIQGSVVERVLGEERIELLLLPKKRRYHLNQHPKQLLQVRVVIVVVHQKVRIQNEIINENVHY